MRRLRLCSDSASSANTLVDIGLRGGDSRALLCAAPALLAAVAAGPLPALRNLDLSKPATADKTACLWRNSGGSSGDGSFTLASSASCACP